jgi:hypothetical protein
MEYKATQFEIIQAANAVTWKWIVFLDATRMRTGIALTRADAVLDAEYTIDKALNQTASGKRSLREGEHFHLQAR